MIKNKVKQKVIGFVLMIIKPFIAYYNTEYKKDEAKNFFESVWEFVEKIFGGGEMTDKTDWPVKRTI